MPAETRVPAVPGGAGQTLQLQHEGPPIKKAKVDDQSEGLTEGAYLEWQRSTRMKADFQPSYFALGITEEIAEVFEAVVEERPRNEILKELGDVQWYCFGFLDSLCVGVKELFLFGDGSSRQSGPHLCKHLEKQNLLERLVILGGKVAGVLKKHLRGDYPIEDLCGRFTPTPDRVDLGSKLFNVLGGLAQVYGTSLREIAQINMDKINKRREEKRLTAAAAANSA